MPTQREIDRDAFLANVKPVNRTIADREFDYYVQNLPTNLEGSLGDMRFNGTKGWWTSPGTGDVAAGKALLRSSLAYFPVLDAPANSRHIGVNNGIVAYAGGVAGTTPTTNDPLFLPFDGTKYVYCPRSSDGGGQTFNRVQAPDNVKFDATTTADIRVKVKVKQWDTSSGAIYDCMCAKEAGVGQLSWTFVVVGQQISFLVSTDGSGWNTVAFADPSTVPINKWVWLRATWGGGFATIYWSLDNASWTQIGQLAGSGSLFNSNAALQVGGGGTYSQSFGGVCEGKLARFEFRSAINGPIVSAFDASLSTQTGYTASDGTVWQFYRAASGKKTVLVEKSCYLLGVDDYWQTLPNPAFSFGPNQPFSLVFSSRYWNDTAGNGEFHIGNAPPGGGIGYSLWRWPGNQGVFFDVQGGTLGRSSAAHLPYGTRVTEVGYYDPSVPRTHLWLNSAEGDFGGSSGDTRNSNGLSIGYSFSGAQSDAEFFGAAVFNSVLSDSAIASIVAAMNA